MLYTKGIVKNVIIEVFIMRKLLTILCLISVITLAGCTSKTDASTASTEIVGSTSAETTTTTVTSVTTTAETLDTPIESTVMETNDDITTTAEMITDVTTSEAAVDVNANSEQVACFEQNGAKLVAYVVDTYTSYVVYYDTAGNTTVLYDQQGPMGAVVESYNSEKFAPYQSFENTVYMLNDMSMGVGQLIKTWHLTPDGTVIDLADTINFDVENKGLYISTTNIDGTEKNVIGLREQIPGTDAIGASQVLPVTLDNEKIVKLDVEPITE